MSASYSWPAGLPQIPQGPGFAESIGVSVSRLPMDSGRAKIRFSALRGDTLSLSYLMTGEQLDTFEDFVKNTIRYTRRFYFPHPRRKAYINTQLPIGSHKLDPVLITSSTRSSGGYLRADNQLTYVADNTPRYENSTGILVEGAATNLALHSVTPENWLYNNMTIGSTIASPDADWPSRIFVETTASGAHSSSFAGTAVTLADRVVASVYVKERNPAHKRFLSIMFPAAGFGTDKGIAVDPATGTFGTPIGITDYGSEKIGDYYRVWAACVANSTSTPTIQLRTSTSINSVVATHTGNVLAGMVLWGRQVEVRPVGGPTSLIRTTATTSARAADIILADQPQLSADIVEAVLGFKNGVAYKKTEVAPNHYMVAIEVEILPI